MDLTALMSSLPALLSMLPLLMQITNLLFLLFFIWFFGSMSMRGFVARKPSFLGLTGTLLSGSLCLFASSSFAGFLPFFDNVIFKIMSIDMMIAGIIVSALLVLSLNLMTRSSAEKRPKIVIEELRRKVMGLEDMLRRKAHHLHETDIRKIAEEAMKGYRVIHSKLVGNDYDVEMKKHKEDKKGARLIIDAWDGEIRQKIMSESAFIRFFGDPMRIAGLAMIIAIALASAVFFEGFPTPGDELTSMLGLSPGELGDMSSLLGGSSLLGDVPEGCVDPMVFLLSYQSQLQDSEFVLDHVYDDEGTAWTVENNCGPVQMMIRVDYEGQDVILGYTTDKKIAHLTNGNFCLCQDISDMI